jgi:hypothetical protein
MLEQLLEMRRAQGVRVANASRGKRIEELDRYLAIEEWIAIEEARACATAEVSLPLPFEGAAA